MKYQVVSGVRVNVYEVVFKRCRSGLLNGSAMVGVLGRLVDGIGDDRFMVINDSILVMGQCNGDIGVDECVGCVKKDENVSREHCRSSFSWEVYLDKCYITYAYKFSFKKKSVY